MNYEELLLYLELEEPSEFIYFEYLADIFESDEYIEQDALYHLLQEVDREVVASLVEDYFEEITNALPDDADDIFSLLDQIKLSLIGLMNNCEDASDFARLAEEIVRFRQWYVYDSQVSILTEEYEEMEVQTVRDAITTARVDKVNDDKHLYNFDQALEYELDSYTMSMAELAAIDEYEEEE